MVKKQPSVGDWVCLGGHTAQEGLIIAYSPFTQFFTIELEDGKLTCEQAEWLIVMD